MNTIFMNSENSKPPKPPKPPKPCFGIKTFVYWLLLYKILAFITHGKTEKAHTITTNLKYLHQHGMINLNYQMDLILYQIFKIILSIF